MESTAERIGGCRSTIVISTGEITRRADAEGLTAQVIERDYILAHAVSAIANLDADGLLVFKGGTSLRLVHLADYRYSADLDFSVRTATESGALDLINTAFRERGDVAPHLSVYTSSAQHWVRYLGPLGRERRIKLDLSTDELVIDINRSPIKTVWDDVPAAEVTAYTLLEVAGEKLRCLLQRSQCRDLYDLYELLCKEGVDALGASDLFRRKAEHRSLDPDRFAAFYNKREQEYKRRWEGELAARPRII